MLFFSTILKAQVMDDANTNIGHLLDVIVPSIPKYPQLAALVVSTVRNKHELLISFSDVELVGKGIVTLKSRESDLPSYTPAPDDIRLKQAVLDRQMVDYNGLKVVRANDIVLGQVQGQLSVLSIDVSFYAIVRRLGFGNFPLLKKMNPMLVPWEQISLVDSQTHELRARTEDTLYERLHPADIANLVEELNAKRGAAFVAHLNPDVAADVLEEMDDEHQLALIEHLATEKAKKILEDMTPDQAADILDDLPDEKAREIIAKLEPEEGQKILELVSYDDREAGGLMTTAYFAVQPEWTVKQVKDELGKTKEEIPTISYIYVIDAEEHYVGVLSLRKLGMAKDREQMRDLMATNVFSVPVDATIKEIAQLMTKYNLFSVGVVDNEQKLLGIVMVDDIMRELFPEA